MFRNTHPARPAYSLARYGSRGGWGSRGETWYAGVPFRPRDGVELLGWDSVDHSLASRTAVMAQGAAVGSQQGQSVGRTPKPRSLRAEGPKMFGQCDGVVPRDWTGSVPVQEYLYRSACVAADFGG